MNTCSCPRSTDATARDAADTETFPLDDTRTLAALALGLAHSRLARPVAVDELAHSGTTELLRDARGHLTQAGDTTPTVLERARGLIDEVLPGIEDRSAADHPGACSATRATYVGADHRDGGRHRRPGRSRAARVALEDADDPGVDRPQPDDAPDDERGGDEQAREDGAGRDGADGGTPSPAPARSRTYALQNGMPSSSPSTSSASTSATSR